MSTADVSTGDYGERLARIEVTLGDHGERLSGIEVTLGDYGQRLSGIEATLSHMATSAELQKVITEVSILKWLLGIVATAVLYAAAKYIVT